MRVGVACWCMYASYNPLPRPSTNPPTQPPHQQTNQQARLIIRAALAQACGDIASLPLAFDGQKNAFTITEKVLGAFCIVVTVVMPVYLYKCVYMYTHGSSTPTHQSPHPNPPQAGAAPSAPS